MILIPDNAEIIIFKNKLFLFTNICSGNIFINNITSSLTLINVIKLLNAKR